MRIQISVITSLTELYYPLSHYLGYCSLASLSIQFVDVASDHHNEVPIRR